VTLFRCVVAFMVHVNRGLKIVGVVNDNLMEIGLNHIFDCDGDIQKNKKPKI
jgi:hypothetical protein